MKDKLVKDYTDEELEAEIDDPKYEHLFACIKEFNRRFGAYNEQR